MCQFIVYLLVDQTVPPQYTQAIQAFLLVIFRSSLEPDLCDGEILWYALSTKIHSTEVPSSPSSVEQCFVINALLFREMSLLVHLRNGLSRPDVSCYLEKVYPGFGEVAREGSETFGTRCNTSWGTVNASLIVNLPQLEG